MTRRTTATVLLLTALCALLAAPGAHAQIGGLPGAYSRMGFGARGTGMGNAMTAVTTGDLVSYYNPALITEAEGKQASAAFGVLGLDRTLNFLSFTTQLPPSAAISAGIINAGVGNIDGRDRDAVQTGALKYAEDQIFLGFAIQPKPWLCVGVNVKFYYAHLYTGMTSTTAAIDLGVLVPVGDALSFGLTVRDINGKYKWDSSGLYGEQGTSSEDLFPLLTTFGSAWKLPDSLGTASVDLEASNASTLRTRFGVEVQVIKELALRGGVDRIDLKQKGNGIEPTFGFTVRKSLEGWTPAVNYAYLIEPFSGSGIHMISISANF